MFHSMIPIVCLLSDYLSNSLIVDLDRLAIFTATVAVKIAAVLFYDKSRRKIASAKNKPY